MTHPNATAVMHKALIDDITRLLGLCTERQQEFFHRLVPNYRDMEKHEDDRDLRIAHGLIIRTLERNEQIDQGVLV